MKSEKPRILQDGRDMTMTLLVLGIAMIVTVGFTGLCSFNPGAPDNGPVREVDSETFLRMETQRVPYPVREPATPEGWQPNSVRAGVAAEHQTTILGFVTANGDYIHALQTSAPAEDLPADGKARIDADPVVVDGVEWTVAEGADGNTRRTWVADLGESRVLLEGSANDDEYRTLAQAMQDAPVLEKQTN
ncbi:DUF4245 domain-containing protein [uncultured Corynebacterium sp.]|uniref:DUF4245 domain-containing protein n=1 Tax=uncultured Corynebacterium sp. TaxID=159447 RepID=UPI0025F459E6|nr:DUF4245 domain-containing protein [uncultured Corynebacterium sp.]